MSVLARMAGILRDPPPVFAFELSEAGIAAAHINGSPRTSFAALERDVISVSPLRDNVLRPEALLNQVRAVAPGDGSRKRRRAALILPDYAVRVTVLDFDSFPSDPREQASLVRFRLKRTVPFEVDSAALGFQPQARRGGGKRVDVAVAVAPLEIVARYEAPFRLAGFQTGLVTTSTLAALELVPAAGLKVLAKRTGRILSLAVLDHGSLKLARSIELTDYSAEEIAGHLFPTFAYIEDQLSATPDTLLICGFAAATDGARTWLESELKVPTQPLASRFGEAGECNAGLLGCLEALKGA
jgi:type IV pilus assembly protein PilM